MSETLIDRRAFLAAAAATPAVGVGQTAGEPVREWQIGPPGDFDTLRLASRVVGAPGTGQVVIDVSASALAGRDRAIARGWFLENKPAELVPLSEGVGEVVAVGPDVSRIQMGDRVVCAHFAAWVDGPWTPDNYRVDVGNTVNGWLAERIILPESGIAKVPVGVSVETAATLAGSGITAWHALHEVARVKTGDTVLSLGTGGVSSWGVLLAKAAGARVVVTSSSNDKLSRMKAAGADLVVNYRENPEWGKEVFDKTGGVDIVLENVGRLTLDQSMLACSNNAMIVMIGTGPLPDQLPKMPGLYIKNLAVKAISNGSRRMLEDMLKAVSANGIEAVVEHKFGFDHAVEAFKLMDRSTHIGKIVIDHRTFLVFAVFTLGF